MVELIRSGVLAEMEEHGVILNVHGERHGLPGRLWMGRSTNRGDDLLRGRDGGGRREISPPAHGLRAHHDGAGGGLRDGGRSERRRDDHAPASPLYQGRPRAGVVRAPGLHANREGLRGRHFPARRHHATGNAKFFAGSDSAPHDSLAKSTDCGCAYGCFTGGIVPQMYAKAFEEAGTSPLTAVVERRSSGSRAPTAARSTACLNRPGPIPCPGRNPRSRPSRRPSERSCRFRSAC